MVFHQLTEPEIVQMVDLLIGRTEKQLANKDMSIELTDAAKKLLAQRGFDPVLGARPLRRTIQREIEDQLSGEEILFGEIEPGQIVLVDVEGWTVELDDQGRGETRARVGEVLVPGRAQAHPGAGHARGRDGGYVGRGGQLTR